MKSQTLNINNQIVTITPTPFEGKLSIEEYETQLYNALYKIGVSTKYITIKSSSSSNNSDKFNDSINSISSINSNIAIISWVINGENFSFSCGVFETFRENFGACTQAIKEDVRHILRGIKDISLILKQYQVEDSNTLDFSHQNPNTDLLQFNSSNKKERVNQKNNLNNSSIDENNTSLADALGNQIISENHAKEIIATIKKKYPNFSNFSYIPDYDRIKLEKAYYYLGRKPYWR